MSFFVTENGEHGATAIWTRAPGPCSWRLGAESLGVGEHDVDVLDELVGRKPAVRLSEIHRSARGDDANADLTGSLDLRLDQSGRAAREDVVVVEDGRTSGERELGEPGARGCVLGVRVDA
jgi:hypothetical protein